VVGQNKSITFDGREIRLTTGLYAPQASGSVMIECGDTSLLVTATKTTKKEVSDFLPLICDYEEKLYAAGRIPGGFMRREGRPPERATLISRLIDRPIRPLFPEGFLNEVQILPTVLSYDGENQPDILSMIASSAALAISGLPFNGPIAASRVGFKDGKCLLNPSPKELEDSQLDLVVAGTKDGITSLQMDIKITGITFEIMGQALSQAKDGRVHILGEMNKALSASRSDVGKHTPKMEQVNVDKKDIAAVIGKGGATIREIVEKSGE